MKEDTVTTEVPLPNEEETVLRLSHTPPELTLVAPVGLVWFHVRRSCFCLSLRDRQDRTRVRLRDRNNFSSRTY